MTASTPVPQPSAASEWGYLERIEAGIPVSWYLDPAILEVEQRVLFDAGPGYVGHELLVPNQGDYFVPSWDEGWALVHGREGIHQVSNVCRHRQSVILEGRGTTRNIVCPLHRWSYSLEGRHQAAPRFDPKPRIDLTTRPLSSWNGLLFSGPRDAGADLSTLQLAPEYSFDGFVYDRTWEIGRAHV